MTSANVRPPVFSRISRMLVFTSSKLIPVSAA
jgi:hypothetical protein